MTQFQAQVWRPHPKSRALRPLPSSARPRPSAHAKKPRTVGPTVPTRLDPNPGETPAPLHCDVSTGDRAVQFAWHLRSGPWGVRGADDLQAEGAGKSHPHFRFAWLHAPDEGDR